MKINYLKLFYNANSIWGKVLLMARALFHLPICLLREPNSESIVKSKLCLKVTPNYSMVTVPLLFYYYDLVVKINNLCVPGDIVECGVWNGGSAVMMAVAAKNSGKARKVWLFDSFEGDPAPAEGDSDFAIANFFEGYCKGDVSKVKEIFNKLEVDKDQICIIKGWFEDTFPKTEINSISVLHIDSNWYSPIMICLDKFYDSVSPGGIIILNDYNRWQSCNDAINDFLAKKGVDLKVVEMSSAGAYLQKPF